MQQILTMAKLILAKQKIVHHGGYYCSIGGKKFIAKHLPYAKALLYQRRKKRSKVALRDFTR